MKGKLTVAPKAHSHRDHKPNVSSPDLKTLQKSNSISGGVGHIELAFTDELVRAWPLAHPGTQLKIMHTREGVEKMLKHVVGRLDLPQPSNRTIEDGWP